MSLDLKKKLKELKVTQKDFAKILGVDVKTVHRWCGGKSKPSECRRKNILIFLDMLKKGQNIEDEVRDLVNRGILPRGITPKDCPGYSELWGFLERLKE